MGLRNLVIHLELLYYKLSLSTFSYLVTGECSPETESQISNVDQMVEQCTPDCLCSLQFLSIQRKTRIHSREQILRLSVDPSHNYMPVLH